MTKKELLRCIAFLLAVCLMLLALCDLFEQENNNNHDQRYREYRDFEENTVDAIYVGTSGVDRYWIAAKAYEEYGMTVYPVSFDACPVWLIPHIIEDALRYQDPQLILLDIRAFTQDCYASVMDTRGRRVIDSWDFWSPVRWKAASRTVELIHQVDPSMSRWDISFHLPFVKHHSKWDKDYWFQLNMGDRAHQYLGFYMNDWLTIHKEAQTPGMYYRGITCPMDPIAEQSLYETLDFIRERNLNVLFIDSPKFFEETEMPRTNEILNILEEEGFECLNFYTEKYDGSFTIELDPANDFYNLNHVNYYGAEKYTAVLAAYLDENYDLPDRRNDEAVKKDWDGVYDALVAKVREYEALLAGGTPEELAAALDQADANDPAVQEELEAAEERIEELEEAAEAAE